MAFFGNKRKDFSIQPPRQQVDGTPFYVTDSANIDFTFANLNLTANLTTTGVTAGTYGDATHIPILILDAYGRVTGVTTTTFSASGIELKTNGDPNDSQTILNLTDSATIEVVDEGGGVIKFNYIGTAGTAAWGSIATGTGVGSQTDLVTYLNSNYYPLTSNPSGFITSAALTPYLLSSVAATTYYPLAGNPSGFLTTAVTSVGLSMPSAFTVTVSPITSTGSLTVVGAGTPSQYVRGDGTLATYNPGTGGGGASVSYYLNGSVSQTPVISGVTYRQMSNTPVIGAGTDFTINTDGYIQSFITDATVPNQLLIPPGNWNFEMYFSATSNGGTPRFYIELYKLSAGTLTLIASNSATPEFITNGIQIDLYTTALAVPSTVLLAADRLAIRVYVIHSSKTITLHTEDNHLCQVITTFSTGITALNGLTDQVQNFATPGTTGTAPNWNSVSPTHTLNIPLASTASVTAGLISNTEFDVFSAKLSTTLANTNIFVGNISNVATAVPMSGDATIANTGAVTIANNAVTYSKMQAVSAASKLLGSSSTTTPVQEITLGTNLSMSGTTLNASGGGITALTGDVTASGTGSVVSTLDANYKAGSAGVIFDGAGGVIATNTVAYVQVPYNGNITGGQIVANAIGSCTITVRKGTFPPSGAAIVTAVLSGSNTAPVTVSPVVAVLAGDWLSFTISGVSTVAWVNLTLSITKTV